MLSFIHGMVHSRRMNHADRHRRSLCDTPCGPYLHRPRLGLLPLGLHDCTGREGAGGREVRRDGKEGADYRPPPPLAPLAARHNHTHNHTLDIPQPPSARPPGATLSAASLPSSLAFASAASCALAVASSSTTCRGSG